MSELWNSSKKVSGKNICVSADIHGVKKCQQRGKTHEELKKTSNDIIAGNGRERFMIE